MVPKIASLAVCVCERSHLQVCHASFHFFGTASPVWQICFKVMWVVSQDVHCEKVWFRLRLDDHSVSCLQLWWRISRDCICMCVKCWVLGEFVLAFLESSKKSDYGSWQPQEPPVQFDRGLGFSSGGFLWAYWSQIYERFSTLVFDVMQRKKKCQFENLKQSCDLQFTSIPNVWEGIVLFGVNLMVLAWWIQDYKAGE